MGLSVQSSPSIIASALTVAGGIVDQGALQVAGNVGFYGAAPVARDNPYILAGAAANHTMQAISAVQPAATGSTNITPFGYTTAAQADAITTAVRNLVTDITTLQGNYRAVLAALQAYGLLN